MKANDHLDFYTNSKIYPSESIYTFNLYLFITVINNDTKQVWIFRDNKLQHFRFTRKEENKG